ncbi:hypothetical protein GEMRC1_002813 [Eukaryota sp. GEM-RC1]
MEDGDSSDSDIECVPPITVVQSNDVDDLDDDFDLFSSYSGCGYIDSNVDQMTSSFLFNSNDGYQFNLPDDDDVAMLKIFGSRE